jgi:hypothetical protein
MLINEIYLSGRNPALCHTVLRINIAKNDSASQWLPAALSFPMAGMDAAV